MEQPCERAFPVLLLLIFGFCYHQVLAGRTGSLLNLIHEPAGDSLLAVRLTELSEAFYARDYRRASDYGEQAIRAALRTGIRKLISNACYAAGYAYMGQGMYDESMKHFISGLEHAGNGSDVNEEISYGHYALGSLMLMTGENERSLKHLLEAIRVDSLLGRPDLVANDYNALAAWNLYQGNNETALEQYRYALKQLDEKKYPVKVSEICNNMAMVYKRLDSTDAAFAWLMKSESLAAQNEDMRSQAIASGNIGELFFTTGNFTDAEWWFRRADTLYRKIGNKDLLMSVCRSFSALFDTLGMTDSAYHYFREFHALHDSVASKERMQHVNELAALYETGKKEQQIIAQTEALKKKKIMNRATAGAGFLTLMGALLYYRRYREKNRINAELESAYGLITEKNREITDSIRYAQRIQGALLQPDHAVLSQVTEHFILFKPRDIVSGDFYWIHRVGNTLYAAVADCTGHGVPGAFMSMMGITFLNEIMLQFKQPGPALILDMLREKVLRELGRNSRDNQPKDGMDMAMVAIEEEGGVVRFSGANNPLWIIDDDGEIKEIKGDKQPVGYHPAMRAFTEHQVEMTANTEIFLFSDGFADQFGGEQGKKYKYKPLRELLQRISTLPMEGKKAYLDYEFERWRGDLEQVDDVCIMGLRRKG